ncbi:hypothetical protein [Capybara microvirus Cap1_SP_188]|nr:hypothetical protein [Capybara microvirus Cap1_SP_188]
MAKHNYYSIVLRNVQDVEDSDSNFFFDRPFYAETDAMAKLIFEASVCSNPVYSMLGDDIALFKIGQFDDEEGIMFNIDGFDELFIMTGSEALNVHNERSEKNGKDGKVAN